MGYNPSSQTGSLPLHEGSDPSSHESFDLSSHNGCFPSSHEGGLEIGVADGIPHEGVDSSSQTESLPLHEGSDPSPHKDFDLSSHNSCFPSSHERDCEIDVGWLSPADIVDGGCEINIGWLSPADIVNSDCKIDVR